jgi:hypothetical protein
MWVYLALKENAENRVSKGGSHSTMGDLTIYALL